MDRISLGISLHRTSIKVCFFNVDRYEVSQTLQIPIKIENGVLSFLDKLDELFKEITLNPLVKQVAMIKVVSDADIAVLCHQKFYKALMLFSGYSKSLRDHFKESFSCFDFVVPKIRQTHEHVEKSDILENGSVVSSNALLFSLKDVCINQAEVFAETAVVQSLGSFVTSLLAGKRASVDSSFGISSGLSIDGLKWSEKNTLWVSNDLKSKLDELKASNDGFSYIGSYFVEKYNFYREARLLPAGSLTGALARGAGGAVFLDTDNFVQLGVIVSEKPDTQNGYLLNGLGPGRFICLVKNDFQGQEWALNSCESNDFKNFELDKVKLVSFQEKIKDGLIEMTSFEMCISSLFSLKQNARPFEQIYLTGELSKSEKFAQLCADLFNCEVLVYNYSDYASAIGCALSGGRKIMECGYEEILQLFFKHIRFRSYLTNETASEYLLGIAIQHKNQTST